MAWMHKEHLTRFEQADLPLHGLFFADGDIVAQRTQSEWTKGMKSPLVMFPSNLAFPLAEGREERVSLVGALDIPLASNRDEAFRLARPLAEAFGYFVFKHGDNRLEVLGYEETRETLRVSRLLLTFDNAQRRLVDVQPLPRLLEPPVLLDAQTRQRLPKLRSSEKLSMDVLAHLKFYSPDSGWIWYVSEGAAVDARGRTKSKQPKVDMLFWGLVVGLEIEAGYFSLSELQRLEGEFGLPVERDHAFTSMTLAALQALHQQEREGQP
jgi:Protein of unknown function (DUF2958)